MRLLANLFRSSTKSTPARRKFLRFFPRGFKDPKYIEWERGYKWKAHEQWNELLNPDLYQQFLSQKNFAEIAARAVRIESRTNLLFSFEKMAFRDAVREAKGARAFAEGLHAFLYGPKPMLERFEEWVGTIATLPRKQTRVLTWPLVTIFGFIALPQDHFFLKPMVTRKAATACGFTWDYRSKPNWQTYVTLLNWAQRLKSELSDLGAKDMIDIQSFLWVQGSDEYR